MEMSNRSARYLIFAQALLIIGLLVCVFIKPHGLIADAGISYFGIYKATVIPYTITMIGTAYLIFKSAVFMPKVPVKQMKFALYAFSIMIIGLLITPYSWNSFLDWSHTILGTILFACQLLITAWVCIKSRKYHNLLYLWLIEFVAGIMCAIYVLPSKGYLIEFQVIFQTAFILLVVNYFKIYSTKKITN